MVTVTSNLGQVFGNLRARFGDLPDEMEVVVVNNVEYAAAVDQGYTRTVVWAELAKSHLVAIIMAMKKKEGKPRVWEGNGLNVTHFEGGYTVTVPPAAMTTKAIPEVEAFGKSVFNRLPKNWGTSTLRAALLEVAFVAQTVLVGYTPVDQGVLIKGWEVKVML